jgi:hypothetical protein
LTPSARSGDLIAGDGTKNGLSRSEQKTLSTTQNNRLTEKAPYKSNANPRAPCPASARPARSRSTTSAAVHGCRGLQKPEVLADLAGLPAFALVRFARVPRSAILLDIRGELMINSRNRNWAPSACTAGVCRCGPLLSGWRMGRRRNPGKRDIATAGMDPPPTAPRSEDDERPQAAELVLVRGD